MSWLVKIEKALFYFFIAVSFWQWRLVFTPAGQAFNEWAAFYFYATDLVLAAIFILWLARKALSAKHRAPGEKKENIVLGFFLFFCALSVFVAIDKPIALFRFIKLLEFVGLYFYVCYNFAALYDLKRFWQCFIAGAALQSLVAIAQFLTQKSLGLKFFAESPLAPNIDGVAKIALAGEKIIRAYGLVPHPNILAAILVAAIFGLTWLWLFSFRHPDPAVAGEGSVMDSSAYGLRMTKIKRIQALVVFVVVFLLLSIALFFTFSRGIIVIGGVLFLSWLVYLWRQKEYQKPIVAISILLFTVCCLLLTVYWPHVSSHYDPVGLPGSQSLDLRAFYNQEAVKMISQKPWLGVGQGNFTVALREASPALPDWQYQPAHNIYLLVAAENGLPALLAFLVFLFLTLRAAWLRRRELDASVLLLTVICLLFTGLFDHFLWDLQQGQILFWLMLGLLVSVKNEKYAEKI